MFAGASNAHAGVTIDMRFFDEISVNEDRKVTRIGTGNRWGRVYEVLEPMGLTVLGGRVSIVGVGGYLLGGKLLPLCLPL
jgi:FAD/FMN-containing dehydrogenase